MRSCPARDRTTARPRRAVDLGSRVETPPGRPSPPGHALADDTVLIRQSKDLTFEPRFILLLIGRRRALLLDAGQHPARHSGRPSTRSSTSWAPQTTTSSAASSSWPTRTGTATTPPATRPSPAARTPRSSGPSGRGPRLLRLHRLAGPGRSRSTWVAASLQLLRDPGPPARLDRGHDPRTGLLHTGEHRLPGHASTSRTARCTAGHAGPAGRLRAGPRTSCSLGCHVEMTRTPGLDYPLGCRYQPMSPRPS